MTTPDFQVECFFITPIGEEGSPERKRADGVMKAMVEPAAAKYGLRVERADEMSEPGTITAQIVEHIVQAKAVVADLTGENANVFYELAVRDAAQLGAVMIAENGTNLPFDKSQDRTIFFETSDLASVWDAKGRLTEFLGASLQGMMGNPIANAMVWKTYAASGKPVEEAIAQLAEAVSEIGAEVHALGRRQKIRDAVASAPGQRTSTVMANWRPGYENPDVVAAYAPMNEESIQKTMTQLKERENLTLQAWERLKANEQRLAEGLNPLASSPSPDDPAAEDHERS